MKFPHIRAALGLSRVAFDQPFQQHQHTTNARDPGVRPAPRAAQPAAPLAPRQPLPGPARPAAADAAAPAGAPDGPQRALHDLDALPALIGSHFPAASPAEQGTLLAAVQAVVAPRPHVVPGLPGTSLVQAVAIATAGDAVLAADALAAWPRLDPLGEIGTAWRTRSGPGADAAAPELHAPPRAHAAAWRVLREVAVAPGGAAVLQHLLPRPLPPDQLDNFALLMKAADALAPLPGDDVRPAALLLRPGLQDTIVGQAWWCAAARLAGEPHVGRPHDGALNGVRNGLYDDGPGSDFEAIDARLQKMGRWLDRAAADRPRRLRNPLAGKSPFRALRRLGVQQVERGTTLQRHRPAFEAALRGAARDLQDRLAWQALSARAPGPGQAPLALVRAAILAHCTDLPPPASMDRHRFDTPAALEDITTCLAGMLGDPGSGRSTGEVLAGRKQLLEQVSALARKPMTLERLERWARQADRGPGGSRTRLQREWAAAAEAAARVRETSPHDGPPGGREAVPGWPAGPLDAAVQAGAGTVARLQASLDHLDWYLAWLDDLDPQGPFGDAEQRPRWLAERDAVVRQLDVARQDLQEAQAAAAQAAADPPLPPPLQSLLRGRDLKDCLRRAHWVWAALPAGGAALARLNERAARQAGTAGWRARLQGPPRPLEGRRLEDFEALVRQDVLALAKASGKEPRLAALAMRSAVGDGTLDAAGLLAPDRALLLRVLDRLGRGEAPPSADTVPLPGLDLQQRFDRLPGRLQAARDEAHGRDTRVPRISRGSVKLALQDLAHNIEGSGRLRLSSGGIVGFGLRQLTASLTGLASGLFFRVRVDARAQAGRQAVFEFAMPPYDMEMVLGTQRQGALQAGFGAAMGPDLGLARVGGGFECLAYAREWSELEGVSLRLPRVGRPIQELRAEGARLAGRLVDGPTQAGGSLLKELLQEFPQLTVNLVDRAGDGRRRHGLTVKAAATVGAASVRATASGGAVLETHQGAYKHYSDRTGSMRVERRIRGEGWRAGLAGRLGFGPEVHAGHARLTSHNTDLALAGSVDLLVAGHATREELVWMDGCIHPISFHETEYQDVAEYLAVMAHKRDAWVNGRLAANPQRDPDVEADRFGTFLAEVRRHATPTQVFAARESLKPAVADAINAGRSAAALAARQPGGARPQDLRELQETERRLLDDPASWQPYSARSYERVAMQTAPGLHLVLVLAALDAAEGSHIDHRFDVN